MSTAIDICAAAYRQANLDQDLTSFSTSQEFPYNISLDILNTVIQEMNRMGNFWFAETKTALTYSAGIYSYSFTSLGIDPKRITRIRKEATNFWGDMQEFNWKHFQRIFRQVTMPTTQPFAFSKFGDSLELDVIPDQDYSLYVYHFKDMPQIANTTDTLLVPATDEDVVREGVYAYLCERMGRSDFAPAYQVFMEKAKTLLTNMMEDAGIPTQMPATF